jgi:hypothetical protein
METEVVIVELGRPSGTLVVSSTCPSAEQLAEK